MSRRVCRRCHFSKEDRQGWTHAQRTTETSARPVFLEQVQISIAHAHQPTIMGGAGLVLGFLVIFFSPANDRCDTSGLSHMAHLSLQTDQSTNEARSTPRRALPGYSSQASWPSSSVSLASTLASPPGSGRSITRPQVSLRVLGVAKLVRSSRASKRSGSRTRMRRAGRQRECRGIPWLCEGSYVHVI